MMLLMISKFLIRTDGSSSGTVEKVAVLEEDELESGLDGEGPISHDKGSSVIEDDPASDDPGFRLVGSAIGSKEGDAGVEEESGLENEAPGKDEIGVVDMHSAEEDNSADPSSRRLLSMAFGSKGKMPHFLNPFCIVDNFVLPNASRNMAVKLVLFIRIRFFCPSVAS